MTTFTKHSFPGLPTPVYLPDWIPVEIKILPSSTPGWTSGQKIPVSNFTSTTFHDTGNMSSTAEGEYRWARDGGRASIGSAGSFNWIVDHLKIIVVLRFDELVGHAANHRGNTTSYAGEQAGIGIDFDGSLDNAMWMQAGVLQSMGLMADTSMYQHNYWSGKDCPGQIRRRGLWSYVEKTVDQRIALISAFILGQDAGDVVKPPVVLYPKPSPIPVLDAVSSKDVVAPSFVVIPNEDITAFFVGDRYEAIRDTPRRQFAYAKSPEIGPLIKKGESFDVDFVFENGDGQWGYTPYGTRVALADLKRVSDTKGALAA